VGLSSSTSGIGGSNTGVFYSSAGTEEEEREALVRPTGLEDELLQIFVQRPLERRFLLCYFLARVREEDLPAAEALLSHLALLSDAEFAEEVSFVHSLVTSPAVIKVRYPSNLF
jgi:hypothetical protein